jgi:GNAT superfamily N-acetyltransferase
VLGNLIVRIADRPDLVPIVAQWLWDKWWRDDGETLEATRNAVAASVSGSGPPQTFVLLVDGEPVGTASLVAHDLDERPALTPWLAGVFIVPEARGRGYVMHLIRAVEDACRSAGIETVWLHTASAERMYARVGWHSVETIQRQGKRPVTLMRRDLTSVLTACEAS